MNTNIRKVQDLSIEGDIYEHYSNLVGKLISSGDSDPKFLSYDSSEPPCPIGPNQFTRVKLTDGSCDLTCFNDSFIKMKIKTTLYCSGAGGGSGKIDTSGYFYEYLADVPYLYVGFKSGIHAIDHYRIYNEKGRGYIAEQSQAIYESALNYFAKSEEEITRRSGCYASYDDIMNLEPNVPGVYLTYKQTVDLFNGASQDIEFEIVVNFDDFSCFQFFDIYPNNICGNLQLELKINNNKNLVVCPIPFSRVLDYLNKGDKRTLVNKLYSVIGECTNFNQFPAIFEHSTITRKFVPFGALVDYCFPAIDGSELKYNAQHVYITAGSLYLQECKSFINGYNSSQSKMNEVKSLLTSNKIYIPAQRIDQYTFSQKPTDCNINCNTTQTLINCSSIIFTFPKTCNHLVCSENPYLDSIQVQIDNKSYPDKPFSTYSLQHSNYILNNLMFNSYFKPNEALFKSVTDFKSFCKGDNTNYMFVISTERKDSDPYVFEGITKNNVFITLTASYGNNSFYANTTRDLPCPIMYLCQDTLWELSSEGTNYYYNDRSIVPKLTGN